MGMSIYALCKARGMRLHEVSELATPGNTSGNTIFAI